MSGEFSRKGHLAELIASRAKISHLRQEAFSPMDEEDEILRDAIERMKEEYGRESGNHADRLENWIQGAEWLVGIYSDRAYVGQILRLNKLDQSGIRDQHAFWEWAFCESC